MAPSLSTFNAGKVRRMARLCFAHPTRPAGDHLLAYLTEPRTRTGYQRNKLCATDSFPKIQY
jgi:hypothetical protein